MASGSEIHGFLLVEETIEEDVSRNHGKHIKNLRVFNDLDRCPHYRIKGL
jgi:hypothetical protein